MGATLWHYEAPWYPDPADALRALQAKVLAERYDLLTLLPERLRSMRQSVSHLESEGDEYGLLGIYTEQVRLLEGLCSRPIPEDPPERIRILREVEAYGGEGIGNVLDVEGIAGSRDYPTAQRLPEEEVERLVGTTRPTLEQARDLAHRINAELNRGEGVCFPFYDTSGRPAGWYFVGNTID